MEAPKEARSRALYTVLCLGALGFVVLLLGPWGWQLNRLTVRLYVFFRSDLPIAPAGVLPEHYGVLLNVVLFVPLSVAWALLTRWSWWRVVLVATASSALVELVQAALLDREGGVGDIVANGLGALLGAVAVMGVRRLRARR
ncbi:MAG: VanZ family protein [Nocardioides sp.]|uniref:VanZ family protein n=1 Tax=Nocardioides sp. TaxID=35761 RepID=UPI002604B30F|nr:VanZ family protein [Nocardioides sp.]MCW2835764.1 VanZ family protein [Nocardioides sp.]